MALETARAGVSHRGAVSFLCAALSLLCLLSLAACAKPEPPPPSAVTPDGLALVSGGPFAKEWERPGADLSRYDAILIEPVKAVNRKDTNPEPVDPRDLARLRTVYQETVERKLSKRASLATEPGPGVVTLRTRVVDLQFRRPATEVDPTTAMGNLTLYRLISSVTIVADLVDSQTGERLYLISDNESVGRPVVPGGATTSEVDYWMRIELAFESWARKLRQLVDLAGSNAPGAGPS